MVPNLFRRLFGEGAVSAAVQPALARAQADGGEDAARNLFARFQGLFLGVLTVLIVGGELVILVWHGWLEGRARTRTRMSCWLARLTSRHCS